jgi:predicted kinase
MKLAGLVVISGSPGSGKTTLARQIAPRLGAVLISKDEIKEILWNVLGDDVVDESRRIGQAAIQLMYAMAARSPLAVVESFFWRGLSEPDLLRLDRPMVQIYCDCPTDTAEQRYRERATDPRSGRHPRHVPLGDLDAKIARWRSVSAIPLDLSAPLLRVDTTTSISIDDVVLFVESQLR